MDFGLITYHCILPMLTFFKATLGSYGWAIIAVTIIVKGVLYPLTKQQTNSMQKMQALQPKIKILQDRFNQNKDRYKDKPAKLKEIQDEFQKDMMEFYQKYKVNPLGGCFPMLIQLPILIALFWAFNGSPFKPIAITVPVEILSKSNELSKQIKGSSNPVIFVGKKGEKARLVLNPGEVKVPVNETVTYMTFKLEGNIDDISNQVKWQLSDKAYYTPGSINKDLDSFATVTTNPDNSINLTTKKEGRVYLNAILKASSDKDTFFFISGLGKTGAVDPVTGKLNFDVIFLVILFAMTIWLSGKVTSSSSPPPSDPKQAEMQKMMQQMMPPMVAIMTLFFPVPSGVLLYFVVSGLIQGLQTWMIMRKPVTLEPAIITNQIEESSNGKIKTKV